MDQLYIQPADARENILACAAFIAERIGNRDGRSDAIREVVKRYLQKGEVDLSAQLADALDDQFVRDRLLSDTALRCAQTGDDEYAMQLAGAIEDPNARDSAFERIVTVNAEKRDFAAAEEIAGLMSYRDAADAHIALYYAIDGHNEKADELLNSLDAVLRSDTYTAIAHAQLEQDKKVEAENYLTSAETAAQEVTMPEERMREMCAIAELWLKTGRKDRAIEVLSKARNGTAAIESNIWRDNWLAQIAQLFFRAGSQDLADATLDMIGDPYQFSLCLKRFAERKQADDNTAEALEDLEEARALLRAQKSHEIRDSRARFDLLAAISVDFAACGKPELAIEAAEQIDDVQARCQALQGIASVRTMMEDEASAEQALRAIDDESQKIYALIGVSDAYRRRDNNERAMHLLDEAHQLLEEMPQLPARADALLELAPRHHAAGNPEKASALMLEQLMIATRILDGYVKAVAVAKASDIYEKLELPVGEAEKDALKRLVGVVV